MPGLNTSFRCFKCLGGLVWTTDTEDTLVPLLTTELAPLFGLRFTVPWLELELGVGLWGPPFLSSLEAVSEDPELTPEELCLFEKIVGTYNIIIITVKNSNLVSTVTHTKVVVVANLKKNPYIYLNAYTHKCSLFVLAHI